MADDDDFLTRCVVDTSSRRFYLYSDQGHDKVVDCDTYEEFMGVLEFCRETLDDTTLSYAAPLEAPHENEPLSS